jgi:O-antigen/teichoic acid export membrane protein
MNKDRKLWEKILGLKGLASIGFADIIGSGITAIFWFFIASQLSSSSYGEIHYYLGIAGVAQIISLIGNSNVLSVYAAKNVKIISTLFFISLIAGFISSLVVIILLARIDAALLIFGYIIMDLSTGVLLGRKLFKKYLMFILLQKILTLVIGIGFYFIFGEQSIIFALILSYLPYIIIVGKELKKEKIIFSQLKQRKDFIINNYFSNLSGSFAGQIDKIIIAPLLGFELLGNYALALQFFVVLMVFSGIVFKYILPQDSSGIKNENLKKGTILISILIAILSSIFLPIVILHLFPQYIETIDAIQIISFCVIPGTISMLYTSKFLALEKSKYVLMSKIFSIVIMITGFMTLGPIFGIIGLSITLVISTSVEAFYLVLVNKFRERNNG